MIKPRRRAVEAPAAGSAFLNKQAAVTAASTGRAVFLLSAVLLNLTSFSLSGGIVLDGSFGSSGALPGPNYMISAGFGKTVGNNLFQSFNQFSLISSESATFTGPANIQNIVSRVTGGSPSSIDGTINSQIQGANLFFVNPAGVVFGSHAQINVSGSFAVSTAHYLKMADGGRFNANLGGQDVLTSAPVSAFGFLNSNPAPVSIANAALNVAPGRSFSVISGDILLDGTQLSAPGGNIALFSARAAGEVAYDDSNPSAHFRDSTLSGFGNITIQNAAKVAIDGTQGGGKIALRGGQVVVNSSTTVSSTNQGSNVGGDIELTADSLSVLGGARVVAQTISDGDGGNVSVQSTDLVVTGDDGARNSSIRSNATSGFGNAGSLIVNTTNLSLVNGGTLNGNTLSAGRGAPITVNAQTAIMSDPGTLGLGSGIFESVRPGATGNASDVNVNIGGALTLLGGGAISDTTFSSGNGGNLNVHAGSLLIDGSAVPGIFTGIATDSNPGATGNTGNLTITVDQALNIFGGGEISTTTFASGNGGNLDIHAGSLSIDGSAAPGRSTGVRVETDGAGDAGTLMITVDHALSLTGGGSIATNSTSTGRGGDLSIQAGSLSMDSSFIVADSNANGDGGAISITVDQALSITGQSRISTDNFSSGKGGDLSIHAGSLLIDGSAAPGTGTGISAQANPSATGNGGNIAIVVDQALSVFGSGEISAATFSSGKGGNLSVRAGSILIDGSATPGQFTGITTDSVASGDAGDLGITVDQALNIIGSGEITSAAFSSGKGGNLSIHAGSFSTDGSATPDQFTGIATDSEMGATGDAGNLTITVDHAFNIVGGAEISARTFSSGHGGNIDLHAESFSIDGSAAFDTGIFASAFSDGNAGNLSVIVNHALDIRAGGQISSSTMSDGKGGNVNIDAGSVSIDSSDGLILSQIVAESRGPGDAGDLIIKTDALTITGFGIVSASAFDSGKGGDVVVQAGSVVIADPGSGIFADSEGVGDAGTLTLKINGGLTISDGGVVSTGSFASGKGGDVLVNARSLTVDGADTAFTGIGADSSGTGDAGSIAVNVNGRVLLTNGGQIDASAFGEGNGGGVFVEAASIKIDSMGSGFFTGIGAQAVQGTGSGGSITVNAGDISLRNFGNISAASLTSAPAGSVHLGSAGSRIGTLRLNSSSSISSANTGSGSAGSVSIATGGGVTLKNKSSISTLSAQANAGTIDLISGGEVRLDGSSITASAGANGGNVHVTTPQLVYLLNSSITATAGTSGSGGTGGNITIDPVFIVLSNSLISANAAAGQGGNINLISNFFLDSNSLLTATGTTNNGTINITAPALDLGSELITLPSSLVSAENQLQERCTALLEGDFSSFISIGRGGTEEEPEELQSEF